MASIQHKEHLVYFVCQREAGSSTNNFKMTRVPCYLTFFLVKSGGFMSVKHVFYIASMFLATVCVIFF